MNVYSITNAQGQVYDKYSVNKKLEACGIPADVIAKGESAINNYASEHQITLPSSDKVGKKHEKHGKHEVKNQVAQISKQEGVGDQFDKTA